ncbi:MAG: hypothetical protein ACO3YQ_05455 [Flavobacteriales bacterium]|jgi:hypothetical protein
MQFTSPTVSCSASAEVVLAFLADPSHLIELLPADRFSDAEARPDGCSFKLNGGIPVVLVRGEDPPGGVRYDSAKGTPVRFFIVVHAVPSGAGDQCEVHLEGEAEVNAFTRMIVEKPLNQVIESLSAALRARFS